MSDPSKEYLGRTREVHSEIHKQFTNLVSACKEKDHSRRLGPTLFSMTCRHIYLFLCPCAVVHVCGR